MKWYILPKMVEFIRRVTFASSQGWRQAIHVIFHDYNPLKAVHVRHPGTIFHLRRVKVYIVWTCLDIVDTTLYYSICHRTCLMRGTGYDDLLLWFILDCLKMAGYCSSVCGFSNASTQLLGSSQYVELHAANNCGLKNGWLIAIITIVKRCSSQAHTWNSQMFKGASMNKIFKVSARITSQYISIAFGGFFPCRRTMQPPLQRVAMLWTFFFGGSMKFMSPGVGCSVCFGNDRW